MHLYTSVLPSSMVKEIDSLEEIILYNWPSQKIKYKDSFISSIDYCEVATAPLTPAYSVLRHSLIYA